MAKKKINLQKLSQQKNGRQTYQTDFKTKVAEGLKGLKEGVDKARKMMHKSGGNIR